VGPRAGLDAVEKRKIPYLVGNRTPAVQPVARPTEISRLMLTRYTKIINERSLDFSSVGKLCSNLEMRCTFTQICKI
jgi:hypothetical protein